MSYELVGLLGITAMLVLFVIGVPVAFSMIVVGLAGFMYISGPHSALVLLANDIYETLSSYSLSVIPMFILMGCFAYASGIGRRLYDTAYVWMGGVRGGLTIATIFACTAFGAICGSATATSATMAKIALPEMKRRRYDDGMATGSIAASGVLGILIPPSTVFIIYGILVEESIGKLFLSGILPGILLCLMFVSVVLLICKFNPRLGPPGPPSSLTTKLMATLNMAEAAALFLFAIGGLFMGWFSPTQSGAIGAAGALLVGLFRRELTWHKFIEAGKDALRTSCMVLFIIMGAVIFGHFMVITNIPSYLADLLGNMSLPPIVIIGIIIFIFFIAGFFMDAMAVIVVAIPIFYPIVVRLGFDPIWFGVVIVLVSGMGIITPPVGVNVFVVKGVARDIPLEVIFKGMMPFLIAMAVFMVILMVIPQIALFLPRLLY